MKILQLTNFYPPPLAGSERYVTQLSENLAKRKNDVHILYVPIAGNMLSPSRKIIKKALQSPPKNVELTLITGKTYLFQIYNMIKKIDPDIIHAHNFKMGGIASIMGWLLKKPVVCSVLLSENQTKGFTRKFGTKLFKTLLRKTHYIAISEDIANSIRRDIGDANIDIVYCWAWNHELIKKANPGNFRKKFPKNAKITFTISRIDEEKGITYLIDAAVKILKGRNDIYFVISGSGPQLNEYGNLVKKLGIENNVLLTGRITEKELLDSYSGCDVIVYPSPMDYLFSVAESLVANKPIVATKVKSAMEIYKHRKNALLVDPRNSKQLADRILEVLGNKNLAKYIAKNAQETAKDFNPSIEAEKIENMYRKIIAQ